MKLCSLEPVRLGYPQSLNPINLNDSTVIGVMNQILHQLNFDKKRKVIVLQLASFATQNPNPNF
jgi:hypothetical protein